MIFWWDNFHWKTHFCTQKYRNINIKSMLLHLTFPLLWWNYSLLNLEIGVGKEDSKQFMLLPQILDTSVLDICTQTFLFLWKVQILVFLSRGYKHATHESVPGWVGGVCRLFAQETVSAKLREKIFCDLSCWSECKRNVPTCILHSFSSLFVLLSQYICCIKRLEKGQTCSQQLARN